MLQLRLPNALVTIRGAVPAEVADALVDLTDPRLHLDPSAVAVTLDVVGHHGTWTVHERPGTGDGGSRPGSVPTGPHAADLLDTIVARLNRLAFAADPDRLHLHAAGVEVDGDGVLLGGPSGSGKSTVAAALVRRGAGYLTDEAVTLLPGSRTAFAYPKPLTLKGTSIDLQRGSASGPLDLVVADNGRAHLRAGGFGRVVPFVVPAVVVLLRHSPVDEPTLSPIQAAQAGNGLLADSIDAARLGPGALEVVAAVLSGCTCWELEYGDASEAAELISELRPPLRRQVAAVHRFRRHVRGGAPSDPFRSSDPSVRIVRFQDGALALDGASHRLVVLDGAAARRIDDAGALVPSCSSTTDDPLAVVLAGTEPAASLGPDPLDLGLPGRPLDVAGASPLTGADVDAAIDGRCTGVVVQQFALGRSAPQTVEERARDAHLAAQATCTLLEHELAAVVDVLEEVDARPVLLKGPVSAHDGLLPPALRDFGDLDLLVPGDRVDDAVAALEAAGLARRFVRLGSDFDRRFAKSVTLEGRFVPAAGMPALGFELDLHRTLAPGPFGHLILLDELHDRAVPVRIAGRWYRSLHPVHRFLHQCLHVTLGSPVPRRHSVRDLELLVPRTDAEVHDVAETAGRWRVELVVERALSHVRGDAPDRLRALRPSGRAERARQSAMLAAYHRGRRSYAIAALASLPALGSWRNRLDYARAHLAHRSDDDQ